MDGCLGALRRIQLDNSRCFGTLLRVQLCRILKAPSSHCLHFVLAVWLLFELGSREVRGLNPVNLFAAGPRGFSEVLPKMQRTVPRVEWCNRVSLSQNWCSCKECFGVFASTASNLANEAGGWVLFFQAHEMITCISWCINYYQQPSTPPREDETMLSKTFSISTSSYLFPKILSWQDNFPLRSNFWELHQKLAVPWLKRLGRVRQRVVTFLCVSTARLPPSPAPTKRIATWLILPIYEMRTKELALQLLVLAGRRRTLVYRRHIEAIRKRKAMCQWSDVVLFGKMGRWGKNWNSC